MLQMLHFFLLVNLMLSVEENTMSAFHYLNCLHEALSDPVELQWDNINLYHWICIWDASTVGIACTQ